MPRIYEEGAFRVYIYLPPREHEPPHVHVVECTEGGEVLVKLGGDRAPPSLWQNHHMKTLHAREALRVVTEHIEKFLEEWKRLHG
ncbi:MAG: DUF4160 domain-containing protein [Gemmatimonadota bacterium]